MKDHQVILSVGMPRAGSGWFYNLTKELVISSGGVDACQIRKRYHLQPLLTEVNCNLGSLTSYRLVPVCAPALFHSPYVLKVHGGRKPLADVLIRWNWIKPAFIFRDPRDALLSAYEYGERMRRRSLTNAFTPLTDLEKAIDFMSFYVRAAEGWLALEGCFSVRYEDLLQNYQEETERLCRHLEIDHNDPEIRDVIDRFRPETGAEDREGMHFVKGKIGRHQDRFSESHHQICQTRFGDFLERYGYPP